MEKNKPLQSPRTIWQVLGISCFLFCAAFFAGPVKASAPELFDFWELDTNNLSYQQDMGSYWKRVWDINISGDCENPFLVVATSHYGLGDTYVKWNDEPVALATTTVKVSLTRGYAIYTKSDPDFGNYELQTWQATPYENNAIVVLLCDIHEATPIFSYDMLGVDTTSDVVNVPQGSLLLSFTGSYVYLSATSSEEFIAENTLNNFRLYSSYSIHDEADAGYEIEYLPDEYGELSWIVLLGDVPEYPTLPDGMIIGDPTCCEGYTCAIPLSYPADLHDTTIAWGIDLPVCNFLSAEAENTMTLDIFAGQPVYFPASSTLAVGDHTLCFAWSNGDYSAIQTKEFEVLEASSTVCAAMDIDVDVWCDREIVCAGLATSTSLWSGLECSGKMIVCWMFEPLPNSLDFLSEKFEAIKTRAPFSLYFSLTDSLEAGFSTTTDDRSGSIGVPMWSAVSSSYYMITIADGSSTEKAIGEDNAVLFRNTQKWIIWAAVAIIILIFLTKKK